MWRLITERFGLGQPKSLIVRMTIWFAGVSFGVLLITTTLLYYGLVNAINNEDDQDLIEEAENLTTILQNRPYDLSVLQQELDRKLPLRTAEPDLVRLFSEDGRVIAHNSSRSQVLPISLFPKPVEFETQRLRGNNIEIRSGQVFRVAAVRINVHVPEDRSYLAHLALERSYETRLLTEFRRWLFFILVFGTLASSFGGLIITRYALRPIRQITRAVRRISSLNLDERLELRGMPSELSSLALIFNDMLGRLEESFTRSTQFSSDIAHELRTPINNLRGEAEVALSRPRHPEDYREIIESSLEEYQRLSRVIDLLLFLARAESPEENIHRQPIDIGEELAKIMTFYGPVAEESGLIFTLEAEEGVVAPVNRTLFQQAIGNLVENAMAHTPPGGTIRLTATIKEEQLCIEVSDTGNGISATDLPYIFERLYRGDPSRSRNTGGLGLGLAIVKSITRLHGGSVRISSELGHGTQISLIFSN